uniref:Uncharacterized protein n=1 Tax=Lepeophtheirus salmonis TaxID=72036 RepID=A0A0K2V1A8_LEPSM
MIFFRKSCLALGILAILFLALVGAESNENESSLSQETLESKLAREESLLNKYSGKRVRRVRKGRKRKLLKPKQDLSAAEELKEDEDTNEEIEIHSSLSSSTTTTPNPVDDQILKAIEDILEINVPENKELEEEEKNFVQEITSSARFPRQQGNYYAPEYQYPPNNRPYNINYTVLDDKTGITHVREETGDGQGYVVGMYEVVEPGCNIRRVCYKATDEGGFEVLEMIKETCNDPSYGGGNTASSYLYLYPGGRREGSDKCSKYLPGRDLAGNQYPRKSIGTPSGSIASETSPTSLYNRPRPSVKYPQPQPSFKPVLHSSPAPSYSSTTQTPYKPSYHSFSTPSYEHVGYPSSTPSYSRYPSSTPSSSRFGKGSYQPSPPPKYNGYRLKGSTKAVPSSAPLYNSPKPTTPQYFASHPSSTPSYGAPYKPTTLNYRPYPSSTPSYEPPKPSPPKYGISPSDRPQPVTPKYGPYPSSTPNYGAPKPVTPKYTPYPSSTPSYGAPKQVTPKYRPYPSSTPSYGAPKPTTPKYRPYPSPTPSIGAPKPTTPKYSSYPSSTPSYDAPNPTTPKYDSYPSSTPSYEARKRTNPKYAPYPSSTPNFGAPSPKPNSNTYGNKYPSYHASSTPSYKRPVVSTTPQYPSSGPKYASSTAPKYVPKYPSTTLSQVHSSTTGKYQSAYPSSTPKYRLPAYPSTTPKPSYSTSPAPKYRPTTPKYQVTSSYGSPAAPAYGPPVSPSYGVPVSPALGLPSSPTYGAPVSPAYGIPTTTPKYVGYPSSTPVYSNSSPAPHGYSTPRAPLITTTKAPLYSSPSAKPYIPTTKKPIYGPSYGGSPAISPQPSRLPAYLFEHSLESQDISLVNRNLLLNILLRPGAGDYSKALPTPKVDVTSEGDSSVIIKLTFPYGSNINGLRAYTPKSKYELSEFTAFSDAIPEYARVENIGQGKDEIQVKIEEDQSGYVRPKRNEKKEEDDEKETLVIKKKDSKIENEENEDETKDISKSDDDKESIIKKLSDFVGLN